MWRRYRAAHRGFLRPRVGPFPGHGISPYRTGDILEALFAQIGELNPDLASDVIVGRRRDADSVRLCDAFKSGCNVNAVPKDVMGLDDDVTDVDAHAESNAAVLDLIDCEFVNAG